MVHAERTEEVLYNQGLSIHNGCRLSVYLRDRTLL
jgi:hypothetical protein